MTRAFPLTLETRVGHIMKRDPLLVYPSEPVTSLRRLFRETRERIAIVVDREGRLEGIVYRGDVLAITSSKSNAIVKDLASEPPVVLRENDVVENALRALLRVDEWYAPVLSESRRVAGVFGLENAIQRMLDENKEYLERIPVGDIMSREVVAVGEDEYASNVWRRMIELRYAGLPVVDSKGRLVGIITQYDFLSRGVRISMESGSGPSRGPRIREIMTRSVEYVVLDDPAVAAAEMMVSKGYGRIPVVDSASNKSLVGIVDREDIVRLALK